MVNVHLCRSAVFDVFSGSGGVVATANSVLGGVDRQFRIGCCWRIHCSKIIHTMSLYGWSFVCCWMIFSALLPWQMSTVDQVSVANEHSRSSVPKRNRSCSVSNEHGRSSVLDQVSQNGTDLPWQMSTVDQVSQNGTDLPWQISTVDQVSQNGTDN